MSKFRIINLVDKLFITVTIFLIIFAWINFYLRSLWTTFILSLIFTSALVFLLYYFIGKKQQKTNQKKETITKINDSFLYFFLTPYSEKINLIHSILSIDYKTSFDHNMLMYYREGKRHLLLISKKFTKLTQIEVLELLQDMRDVECDFIDIICSEYDTDIKLNILKNKQVNLIDKNKLYNDFFLKHNIYPSQENINKNISRLTMKDIIKNFFLPQKAKSYFICGLILIFSSFIIPYNAYYIIVGSMLLMFSLICKIRPKFDI